MELSLPREPLADELIASRRGAIVEALLAGPGEVDRPTFLRIGVTDLELMFERYDGAFFEGALAPLLEGRCSFRLSKRMTRMGGKTVHYRTEDRFEIVLSLPLLFQSFGPGQRPVHINGLEATSRLDAAMLVFEHELVHLVELLVWGRSTCRGRRFATLARRLFGHRGVTHGLVTGAELTRARFGIVRGAWVELDGPAPRASGVVVNVGRRVTVMVPEAGGPYIDARGVRYVRHYVAPDRLRVVEPPGEPSSGGRR